MTPTRFDIYVRQDNRWQLKGSMAGEDKDSALAQGAKMDAAGEFQGVRIMAVTEYGEGRAPLETLAWISPHLSNVAAVTRQMKRQASAASENVAAREAASADVGKEPRPSMEAPSPASSAAGRRQTDATSPFRAKSPPDPGAQARQLAGKVVSNTVISIAIAILAFILVSILIKNFGASLGVPTAHQGKVTLGAAGLAFLISASVLLGRVYRTHVDELPKVTVNRRTDLRRDSGRRTDYPRPRAPRDGVAVTPSMGAGAVTETDSSSSSATPSDAPTEKPTPAGGLTQQMRRAMLEFLAKSLTAIAGEVPTVNRHVSFGLNLFISGAAERYAKHVSLSPMQGFVLVREMVEALGNSPDRVDAYCRQYAEYKAEER